MKPIILHIGSTKTGTSSLQQYLTQHAADLLRQGVVYPMAGRNAGGQIAHHNLCYERQPKRVEAGVFKPAVGTWSQALSEIDTADAPVGVISSEAFMNARPPHVPRFAETLAGRDVTIVAYVRRQDRWLQSAWNQQARFGRCGLDFWGFYEGVRRRGRGDYHRMLAPWSEAFGADHVNVRNFDALPSGGIVPDFFGTFLPDVEVASTDDGNRSNTKAGIKQLVAVAKVLEICRERVGPEFQLPSTSAIRIAEFFRDRDSETTKFSVLSYADACDLAAHFSESNQQLSTVSPSFGRSGGFPDPVPAEFKDYVDLTALGEEIFLEDERRFVQRMAREVSRVGNKGRSGSWKDVLRGALPGDRSN